MNNTVAPLRRESLTLVQSGGLWHPAWCENRESQSCDGDAHHSPNLSGRTKRLYAGSPELRWQLHLGESSDSNRGSYIWGMVTATNEISEKEMATVIKCDPIEAFLLGQDLIAASNWAYGRGLPQKDESNPAVLPSPRTVLAVVR